MLTYAEKKWGDCSNAVAYEFNFSKICIVNGDYWLQSFKSSTWHDIHYDVQISSYMYPKGKIPKNDYYTLIGSHSGVSKRLMNDMIEFGVNRDNFLPIFSKTEKSQILGYSILAKNILPPIYQNNWMHPVGYCDMCDIKTYEYIGESYMLDAYNGMGYPTYIPQEASEKLMDINRTFEFESDTIISLDLYNYLIKKYPKLECRPVFIGNLCDDKEFIRTHSEGFKSRLD